MAGQKVAIMSYQLTLTEAELDLVKAALDSHEYWQLTGEGDRNNGYSLVDWEDGDEQQYDEETDVEGVRACRALCERLEQLQKAGSDDA